MKIDKKLWTLAITVHKDRVKHSSLRRPLAGVTWREAFRTLR